MKNPTVCVVGYFLQVLVFSVMTDSAILRRSVVKSFEAGTFTPQSGPFRLFENHHWQTIIGSEALQMKFKGGDYPR